VAADVIEDQESERGGERERESDRKRESKADEEFPPSSLSFVSLNRNRQDQRFRSGRKEA
jgi:hypothetical protein